MAYFWFQAVKIYMFRFCSCIISLTMFCPFHFCTIFAISVSQNSQTQHCKALAIAARRAMLMSLVQPSPQLLLQFDKVLLMSKGSGTLPLASCEIVCTINSHQTLCKTIGDGFIHLRYT